MKAPWKTCKKNLLNFLSNFLKKYFSNKNFVLTTFWLFLTTFRIFKDLVLKFFQYNVLFFIFKSKVLYLLSQVLITITIYIFMLLKDTFVVLQPFIF